MRVVYRHFGCKGGFPNISEELLDAVDQADSAQYSAEDILAPKKWTVLNFIIDPRTGMEGVDGFSIAVGKSVLDRTSKTDIGALLLEYGGGGHEAAGGCRIENDKAEEVLAELIGRINADG